MATLMIVARAIETEAHKHPREAAPYFMAAFNAVLDCCPPAAVHMVQVIKWQARIEQHTSECRVCQRYPLDCPIGGTLYSTLEKHEKRLRESETHES